MAKKRRAPGKVTGTRYPAARRPKLHEQTVELRDEIERRTAFAVGLPPGLLTKDEKRFLPGEFDVDIYLSVLQTQLPHVGTSDNALCRLDSESCVNKVARATEALSIFGPICAVHPNQACRDDSFCMEVPGSLRIH